MTTTEKPAQENTLASPSPDEPGAETLTLSVGPQHSGSGHMRLIVELDGDIIINAEPDPGYVHRGIEKIIELRNIIRSIPVIERPSIIDASNLNHAWVRAIEELQGVEPPARGQYLRCLLNEMNRIMSHLYWLSGCFPTDSIMCSALNNPTPSACVSLATFSASSGKEMLT